MCDGILFFDEEAIIVIHVSKSSNIHDFEICLRKNVYINPDQYETSWGCDFTVVHVSNYLLVKDKFDISYIIFLTSNMLMIKNPNNYIKDYDSGFNDISSVRFLEKHVDGWWGELNRKDYFFNILNELDSDTLYGGIIDGVFVTKEIMNKICELHIKYFDFKQNYEHAFEEKFIPTIAYNISNKISQQKCQFTFSNSDFENFKENIFFMKKVERDMNNIVRKTYSSVIYNGSTNTKYLGYFDAVYYINLDSRTDRKEFFEKQAKELDIPAIRFSAITPKEGEFNEELAGPRYYGNEYTKFKIGCTISHQSLIRKAKENNWENILIFEDDCVFLDNFKEKAQLYVNELKNIKWDIFYFGGDPSASGTFITENLATIVKGGVYQTHAYAINHNIYDQILQYEPLVRPPIVIDEFISSDAYIKILGKEILAIQSNSYSDLWGYVNNSQDIIKKSWLEKITNSKLKYMEHFYHSIDGWFNFQDIYTEMVNNASDGDHFVEIGVWKGCSSAYMGVEIYNSNKNIIYDAIDCFDVTTEFGEEGKHIYNEAKYNLKSLIEKGIINLIKGYSEDVSKNYEDESISFCFIDAAHDYDSVKNDILTWLPKVKVGGVLAGHDYDEYHIESHNAVNDTLGKENVVMRGTSFFYRKINKI